MSHYKPTPQVEKLLKEELPKKLDEAAQAILDGDILLLATGAGFSKDSGLAVYKDIANVDAWRKRHLTYLALCKPHWIESEPETFYGFWGKCFNDYRSTKPHAGYDIIKRWKETRFANNKFSETFKKAWKERYNYCTEDQIPGPFFINTSNVDNHSITAGFSDNEIDEIHGSTEVWQCMHPCKDETWSAPANHLFVVDDKTMLAPSQSNSGESQVDSLQQNLEKLSLETKTGFESNHPRCIHGCGRLARPAILMFGDYKWIANQKHNDQSARWFTVVKDLAENHGAKVVILEIGAGINVPTIRSYSEHFMGKTPNCTLIRINPDFPLNSVSSLSDRTISIMQGGLKSIEEIDLLIEKKLSAL
eukprot:TRINITY_DN11742_c0_g1_i1.p1 TRINITY_DN11742_c0_g1~~TRINITY_DN11742_c0_g1_i1.p1  ORF type:complete len:362 (+),score=67.23 TRINITY_DN11742_c0_g1_i1:84-1169(+)